MLTSSLNLAPVVGLGLVFLAVVFVYIYNHFGTGRDEDDNIQTDGLPDVAEAYSDTDASRIWRRTYSRPSL